MENHHTDHDHSAYNHDQHAHGHHTHGHHLNGQKLFWATALNFLITIVQIVGGIFSNSLALISDAVHNFSDASALLLAWFANRLSQRKSTSRQTFGYQRIEILAALFNAVVLIVISIFLIREAYFRWLSPEKVDGPIMLIIASIGLIANGIAVLLLHRDSKKNVNIKAAYLHLLGDTLSSVAVIIGGIFIWLTDIDWIDPLVTALVALYILWHTGAVIKQTIDILMQFTPSHINLKEISKAIETLPNIENIHHVHLWNLTDQIVHFECHVDLKIDLPVSATQQLTHEIEEILHHQFEIDHVTIQFELNCCTNKELVYETEAEHHHA